MKRRVDMKAILADPEQRREMMIEAIMFIQAVERIETTKKQAEEAYDKARKGTGKKRP